MAGDIPTDVANFLGSSFAMLLYGAYICIFAVTIRLLRKRKRKTKSVYIVLIGLFITTTATIALNLTDNYEAFIIHRLDPGTIQYFDSSNKPLRDTRDFLLLLSALLADGLICWRLFVIWDRSINVLIVPALILLAEAGVGVSLVVLEYYENIHSDGRFQFFFRFGAIFICISSVIVNILVTALIVTRLWWAHLSVEETESEDVYTRIIVTLVESGFLYTAALIIFFACVVSQLPALIRFVDYLLTVIVAIAPTLIILNLNYAAIYGEGDTDLPASGLEFTSRSHLDLNRDLEDEEAHRRFEEEQYDMRVRNMYGTNNQTTLPTSPLTPGGFQVTLSHASSSTLTVNRSKSGGKGIRLRHANSQASTFQEESPTHWRAQTETVRESWRGEVEEEEHDTGDEDDEHDRVPFPPPNFDRPSINSSLHVNRSVDTPLPQIEVEQEQEEADIVPSPSPSHARLSPLPPNLSRRPSSYFSAVSGGERRDSSSKSNEGIEMARLS